MKRRAARKRGRPEGSGVAALTRNNILRAAVFCFARSGYAQTGNQDIAHAAGITSGSLYHHFDSKAAIYREALRHCTITLVETYRSAFLEAADRSCIEQLCLGLEGVIAVSRAWPGMIRFAGNAAAEIRHNPELDWLHADDAQAFTALFRELLQGARERGELAADVTVEEAAQLLLMLISGLAIAHDAELGEARFAATIRSFERLVEGKLLKKRVARK
jgi:AcrR family transcriptional regulator